MMQIKRFSGILNTDDKEADVLSAQHIRATNIRFTGGQQGLTAENIKGNVLVANSNLPAGTNECIGSFFDQVGQQIIFFNYNSNGNHGIYSYSVNTELVTQVFRCGVNSASDVLTFSLNYPITSAAIVYRTAGEGDLLYWTDGTNKPMYLNLATVSTLSPFTANMLYAAKTPPLVPPTVAYASDATKNFNYVRNRYFRFAYRWVYLSSEKSTFSPTSTLSTPANVVAPQLNYAPNSNNYITVAVNSAATADFEDIEIFGQEFNGTTWGDFFLINSVNKSDVGAIPFTYTFSFYNDGIYNTVLPAESDLRWDWLPDKANCLELLNGNTIIYGGITEGYNKMAREDVDVQVTTSLTSQSTSLVTPIWKWANYERLAIAYFDELGKVVDIISFLANSTIDTTNFNVTTPEYPGQPISTATMPNVPKINASINHLPPSGAVSYQWLRIDNAPPYFLQYLTNDYQTDSDYIYLCIQGLIFNNTTSGFLPSYEFSSGDRVRVMGVLNIGTSQITQFSIQYDFQILDVVEKVMGGSGNPATNGSYLKCSKPSPFPTPAYGQYLVIEIYTPPSNVNDSTAIFYEWGQRYAITGGYHMGQTQNQTASLPALFEWTNGYVWFKLRGILGISSGLSLQAIGLMDRNYNDFQESKANSNSRGWPIDVNAKQQYFPVTSRWGGSYVQDTDINNLNRFYPENLDTIDRSKGDIRRFKQRDRILRVFQDRGVGNYGVYARYVQNNEGSPELVTTNEIITTNNIQYYQGVFGLGGYSTNLCSSPIADYFTDVITGRGVRLGYDGMTDIGVLYKGQYYFPAFVTPYNKTQTRSNGASAKVMGFFDTLDGDFHTILQAPSGGTGYHFAFNEPRNGYVCDVYSYIPEWATCANDVIFSWNAGNLYKHNSETRCNFFGSQFGADITVVFNDNLLEKKSWNALSEVASGTWACPVIYTNTMTYGSQRQETTLVEAEFQLLEGMPSSSIKRDANSPGGKVNGNFLKGNWMAVKFSKTNASNYIILQEVSARATDSPRTDR